jgi:guanidinopropionase
MFDKMKLDLVFGSDYRRPMPYAGIPTLLDAPYQPDAVDQPGFAGLDVALVGVPMDLGVTNRPGARFGPRALRVVERIGPYNHALGVAPRARCTLADIGDVPMRSRYSLEQSIEDIERAPGIGRWRPFDHLSDPEGSRCRAAAGSRAYRRALRHGGSS